MNPVKPTQKFTAKTQPEYKPDATNDPLVGTQGHPDQRIEQDMTPEREATAPVKPRGPAVKSRALAGWLGIFLGALGVHRFYLGYTKVGAFQLAMFLATFGLTFTIGTAMGGTWLNTLLNALGVAAIVWLWGLIEGAMILGGMLRHDGHGRPLR